MQLTQVVKGAATYIPGLYELVSRRRTGGTDTAAYCYGVWLKHLVMLWASGLRAIPDTIAELGPGDSIGTGLAALLSGVNHYYALDVVRYPNTPRNVAIFDQLVEMFKLRASRPSKGWPDFDLYLDANLFPSHILTGTVLEKALAPDRLAAIRAAIAGSAPATDRVTVRYTVPWNKGSTMRIATVDLVFSHSVLEHVVDVGDAYRACALWLKPRAWMSHQIDFTSHGFATEWNGQWTYPDWIWRVVAGRRPFAINRQPCSWHLKMLQAAGFEVVCCLKLPRTHGIGRSQLAAAWKGLSDDDLSCAEAFIQARKA